MNKACRRQIEQLQVKSEAPSSQRVSMSRQYISKPVSTAASIEEQDYDYFVCVGGGARNAQNAQRVHTYVTASARTLAYTSQPQQKQSHSLTGVHPFMLDRRGAVRESACRHANQELNWHGSLQVAPQTEDTPP
jgi:hypothetical protein